MSTREVKRDGKDQRRRPHVDRIEKQRLMATKRVRQQPNDEPEQRHPVPPDSRRVQWRRYYRGNSNPRSASLTAPMQCGRIPQDAGHSTCKSVLAPAWSPNLPQCD
jgi:hypothetical protein